MNGARAKALRRQTYGVDFSPGSRTYAKDARTGTVYADVKRRLYQRLKGRGRLGIEPQVKKPVWKRFAAQVMPFFIWDRTERRKLLKKMKEGKEKKKGVKPDVAD